MRSHRKHFLWILLCTSVIALVLLCLKPAASLPTKQAPSKVAGGPPSLEVPFPREALDEVLGSKVRENKLLKTSAEVSSLAELMKLDPSEVQWNYCDWKKLDWDELPVTVVSGFLLKKASFTERDDLLVAPFLKFLAADDPAKSAEVLAGSSHPALRFYRALALGDLMVGGKFGDGTAPLDLQTARNILVQLAKQFPENGAFPFFLAAVEEKLGSPEEKVRSLFWEAFAAGDFNVYLIHTWQEIFKLTAENPAYYFPITRAIEGSPAPNYALAYAALRKHLSTSPDFARAAAGFGEKMAGRVLLRRDYGEAVFFDDFELYLGRRITEFALESMGEELSSDLKKEGASELGRSFSDRLMAERRVAFPQSRKSNCDSDGLANYVFAISKDIEVWRKRGQGLAL